MAASVLDRAENRKVFVTNYAGHDYIKAEKYGKLVFITRGFVNFHAIDRLKYSIAQEIQDSTEDDYLCLSGSSLLSAIIVLLWYEKHGTVKILNWDKKGEAYTIMEFSQRTMRTLLESFTE